MKFIKVEPPKSPRTDYISEDGKVRLVKDDSAGIATRYMATINIREILVYQFGSTPGNAVKACREEALRLANELRDIASLCADTAPQLIQEEKAL